MKKFLRKNFNYSPEKYWFKRKLFRYGWVPASWQGWLVSAVYVLILAILANGLDSAATGAEVFWRFLLPAIILSIVLIVIAYKKGQRPKWLG